MPKVLALVSNKGFEFFFTPEDFFEEMGAAGTFFLGACERRVKTNEKGGRQRLFATIDQAAERRAGPRSSTLRRGVWRGGRESPRPSWVRVGGAATARRERIRSAPDGRRPPTAPPPSPSRAGPRPCSVFGRLTMVLVRWSLSASSELLSCARAVLDRSGVPVAAAEIETEFSTGNTKIHFRLFHISGTFPNRNFTSLDLKTVRDGGVGQDGDDARADVQAVLLQVGLLHPGLIEEDGILAHARVLVHLREGERENKGERERKESEVRTRERQLGGGDLRWCSGSGCRPRSRWAPSPRPRAIASGSRTRSSRSPSAYCPLWSPHAPPWTCEKESEVRSDKDSEEEEETYLSPMMAFSTSQSSRHAPWEMMASETWQFCTLAGGRNLGEVKMGLRAS